MNPHFESLGFDTILNQLKEHALSEQVKQTIETLTPYLSEDQCRRKMAETTAARKILDGCGSPPLASMKGLAEILNLCEIGAMLSPEQLTNVAHFAASCKRTSAYLKRGESMGQVISSYRNSIIDLEDLQKEIEACVSDERVYDEASPELRNIRRKMEHMETQIKEKLAHVLQSRKQYLADSYISKRNGHYVLPVQRRYQNQFGGTVIEASNKGSTVFMEPTSISNLQGELALLQIEEDGEIRRVLYTLTASVSENAGDIRRNMEVAEILDFLFAKAKYSAAIKAGPAEITGERKLVIRKGRHPLLNPENCVPLDFYMDENTSGVVITGPNTGGKTVAVKTVGLLSLMAQSGLHVPCEEESCFAMQDFCWCDIGDSQNITQNLSTFSGHITNVIRILDGASRDSLVLLDELGSGTDPVEGMGIAVAVLEELRLRGCMFLVTTHYPQVKLYAEQTTGVQSARMAFDKESMQPLYRLELGKSGESCALYIAKRLGLAPHLLERAHCAVYGPAESGPAESGQTAPVESKMKPPKSKLIRTTMQKASADPAMKFQMGDSVEILPEKEVGIVYRSADENGEVVVQVKGVKQKIRHNRLKLKVAASELYPPDYDFSIIFDTVENRKARHILNKRYDSSVAVVYEQEEFQRRP